MDDRPFPQSVEAERALLGGILLDPDKLDEVAELIQPKAFYRPDHGELFSLLVAMRRSGEPIDLVTLPKRLVREGHAEKYGGVAYVVELPDHAPATSNLGHYADVINRDAVLRKVITTSEHMRTRAYDEPHDLGLMLQNAAEDIAELGTSAVRRKWSEISQVLDKQVVEIQALGEMDTDVTGVTTGFVSLDRILAGMQGGDLIILAARPSMGKTALALNIAQNAAVFDKVGVGVFSLEMGAGQLVNRMLCSEGMIPGNKLRTGKLDTHEFERLLDASETLRRAKVFIDDESALSIGEVRSRAQRLKSQCPELGLIMVDYLQLMRGDDPKENRLQQVSAISRGLKAMAKDLGVPVLALSQLSRALESRQDKRPMLSDLRESGAIEQDADVIMFIYRDHYYTQDPATEGQAEVIIAKQRNGSVGRVTMVFEGQYTLFSDLEGDAGLMLPEGS